jgi:hypothetical protein
MRQLVAIAFAGLLLCSCRPSEKGVTAREAEELAIADATAALPQVPWRTEVITTVDLGARWRVTFTAPGSTGDSISVEVDKATGKVLKGVKGPCYNRGDESAYGSRS